MTTTSHQARDAFELSVIAFQDGRKSLEDLAQEAYSVVRRFARVAAHAAGIEDEAEDVAQALWIMFVSRIAQEYDRRRSIYPYITTYARNIARNVKWQRKSTPQFDEAGESDGEPREMPEGRMWGADELDVDEAVSRRIAMDKVHKILAAARANPAPHHGIMPGVVLVEAKPIVVPQKSRKKPELSPEQRELVEIRLKLGMTQPEFADVLGINVPRLSSWEYGRTKSVPQFYLEQARQLMACGNRPYDEGLRRFGDRKMSDILSDWAKELGTDLADIYTLASLLEVSEPTIRRWINNQVRPSITKLNLYQAKVDRLKRSRAPETE